MPVSEEQSARLAEINRGFGRWTKVDGDWGCSSDASVILREDHPEDNLTCPSRASAAGGPPSLARRLRKRPRRMLRGSR